MTNISEYVERMTKDMLVYSTKDERWMTSVETVQRFIKGAATDPVVADAFNQFINMSDEERAVWICASGNVTALAHLMKKNMFEVPLDLVEKVCLAWDAGDFFVGYLRNRRVHVANSALWRNYEKEVN